MLVLSFKLPLVDGDGDADVMMVKVVGKNMATWWVY
jgi:hypothetical protein